MLPGTEITYLLKDIEEEFFNLYTELETIPICRSVEKALLIFIFY